MAISASIAPGQAPAVPRRRRHAWRPAEATLLLLVIVAAGLGFGLAHAALALRRGVDPLAGLGKSLAPAAALAVALLLVHFLLCWRGVTGEQILLPIAGLLVATGLVLAARLGGTELAWQQVWRGLIPGFAAILLLVARPGLIERIRRGWPMLISLGGLGLLLATAFFGLAGPSGARLSLQVGSLPPVETTELIKLALIVFLAWYIENWQEEVEGRARLLGRLRLPSVRYFVPGLLFVSLATLALVRMSDFGAILILGAIFVGMLYAGFQTRIFATIAAIGLALSLVVGLLLVAVWHVPPVIQVRIAAWQNPWSREELVIDGQPAGLTVAEGPGYQIQQALLAAAAGGLSGTGLGMGWPLNVPLVQSDFVLAAVAEELGVLGSLALLATFAVLLLRLLRLSVLLPRGQLFERLLLVGIGVHLCAQVFVMGGGTYTLIPLTGITVPFLSQGGMSLAVNLAEVGLALALAQRSFERLP
jgi:cell division protein FtsW (lipid II flippase)